MIGRRAAVPMLDLLLLMLCWVVLLVNPAQSDGSKPIADFTLIVAWDLSRRTDVDVYIRGPDHSVAWFRSKTSNAGDVSIDRDDRGLGQAPLRQEVVSFREPSGSYLVSIHTYRDGQADTPGSVHLLLSDRAGRELWFVSIPIPARGQEVPIVELEFSTTGEFVQALPSTALIRHGARRSPSR